MLSRAHSMTASYAGGGAANPGSAALGTAQTLRPIPSVCRATAPGPSALSYTGLVSLANSSARRCVRPGRRHHLVAAAQPGRGDTGNGGTDEDPDWEAEMNIFNQRISRPNQLATLRELEAQTALGKVLYSQDGLVIVSGLNTDAPLGTKVSFLSGTSGVLLWHRSDNLSFCLVLGDPATVCDGTRVECKIKGVLQVVDDAKGPVTRKDFEVFSVPASDDMFGRVHDHIGRHLPEYDEHAAPAATAAAAAAGASASASGSASDAGSAAPSASAQQAGAKPSSSKSSRPLVNTQVDMKDREQINESLLTGVKGLDILTPLGRGASLLVIGQGGTGKTRLALDAVQGQARFAAAGQVTPPGGPVRCVVALVGRPKSEVQAIVAELRSSGALPNTAVVVSEDSSPLAHQYAAMCCACSIGERVRDEGGHSLVVVDDIKPLTDVWEQLLGGLAGLGARLLREGLVKDEQGRDMPVVAPPTGTGGDAPGPAAAPAAAGSSAASAPAELPLPEDDDTALVEYQGMLISGAMAQRRGFLSTFFMRAAKMSRSNGGGSMSLLPLVPGTCATGISRRIDMSKYKTLSPEQLAKLEAAMRAKQLAEELSSGGGRGELATEVVEEFISIADGQVVLAGRRAAESGSSPSASASASPSASAYAVNPKLSITRIGTRAYYKALQELAPQMRLDLSQADDARRFSATSTATSSASSGSSLASADLPSGGGAEKRADALAQRLSAALLQEPGEPTGLAEQVATLFAVQRGFLDCVPPEQVAAWLRSALAHVRSVAPAAMQELGRTGILTATAEKGITDALRTFTWRP